MSVVEFARRIGKSRATVYRYESDEIEEMPYTVLVPIAEALNTTPTYLMGYENESVEEKKGVETKNIKLIEMIAQINLTEDEINDIISYIEFILTKRKWYYGWILDVFEKV